MRGWPVAERPNVFHISTATVSCLHLLSALVDVALFLPLPYTSTGLMLRCFDNKFTQIVSTHFIFFAKKGKVFSVQCLFLTLLFETDCNCIAIFFIGPQKEIPVNCQS